MAFLLQKKEQLFYIIWPRNVPDVSQKFFLRHGQNYLSVVACPWVVKDEMSGHFIAQFAISKSNKLTFSKKKGKIVINIKKTPFYHKQHLF